MSAGLPSREQLLGLIDSAGRRVLTPAEVHLLKVGVVHLASQLTKASGTIRQLTGDLEQVRAERDEARREVALSGPRAVPCGFCGSPAGVDCRGVLGGELLVTPHTARLDAAQRWLFRQALGEAS